MANFTQTVTNRIEMFGNAPASYFDRYNWNEFIWGEGTAPLIKVPGKVLGNVVNVTEDSTEVYLRNRAGYYYNFPDRVTNAHSRYSPTWTQVTVSSTV